MIIPGVAYVTAFTLCTIPSLPRHKNTGNIKGFAFVEFASQEAAATAVEVSEYAPRVSVWQCCLYVRSSGLPLV